jgi:hypothetical protein
MDESSISVYWQDQSTTEWMLLGKSSDEDFELRWNDYDMRPASKWLRLGLLFRTNDETKTPIVRAHRVKSHAMVTDRARWSFTVMVHDEQEMLDGELNIYSAADMNTHLRSLVKSIGPIIFMHPDGTYHETKLEGYRYRVSEYEQMTDSAHIKYEWSFTLLEVTPEEYVPAS